MSMKNHWGNLKVLFKIIESERFNEKIKRLENELPRILEFRKGLHFILERNPFNWGTPIPKEPNWKYGLYFVGKSDSVGRFPSFEVAYRITDDTVFILDMGVIKF